MHDYSFPLLKENVAVHLHFKGSKGRKYLNSQVEGASKNYGFQYTLQPDLNTISPFNSEIRHSLLIIVSDSEFEIELVEKALSLLKNYSIISLAFQYPNFSSMMKCSAEVEKFKKLSNDRLNFLRPRPTESNRYLVPNDKIVDNSICDSVRIKYKPIRINKKCPELGAKQQYFFQNASTIFHKYHLYHRSLSDGYFACRTPDRKGFFITATKTYKNNIDLKRIVFVHHYDQLTNTIKYSGNFLPSSDSVEAAILFQNDSSVLSVIHTHASDRFTRNPNYIDRILVGIMPYGECDLGLKLVEANSKVTDGFVIMEDHGEVFTSRNYDINNRLAKEIGFINS